MEAVVEAHPIANSVLHAAGSAEDSTERVLICLVPVELVAAVVEDVAQWIEAAMRTAASGAEPMAKVRARLESGQYRLMLAGVGRSVYAAAVLELTEVAGRSALFIVAAGGAIGQTLGTVAPEMWRGILALGRELGVGVALKGRPGWERWCRKHGGGARVKITRILLEAR